MPSGDVDAMLAFWQARLDEDQAGAEAAQGTDPRGGRWVPTDHLSDSAMVRDEFGSVIVYNEGSPVKAEAEHIAAHDPARTLREVEADRQLLSAYEAAAETCMQALYAHGELDNAETKRWLDVAAAVILSREVAAKLRVSVYRDHHDYDEGWAP